MVILLILVANGKLVAGLGLSRCFYSVDAVACGEWLENPLILMDSSGCSWCSSQLFPVLFYPAQRSNCGGSDRAQCREGHRGAEGL